MHSSINHLLIVDDNLEDQTVYQRYISKTFGEQIHIHVIDKGMPALQFIKENKVDCILLDYQLPDMTGLDFLEKLSTQFKTHVPIIMLTGTGNEKVAVDALKLGAYDYLNKGEIQQEILYKTIANAVEKAILTKRLESQEAQIEYLAYYDYLTGVPNRAHFENRLREVLTQAQEKNQYFTLLLLDLDRFKSVNDKHGHEVGDTLLKEVTKLFKQCLRKTDLLARVGGDEFAIILNGVSDTKEINNFANKLLQVLSKPIIINDNQIAISPSIGIACFPLAGKTISKMVSNADIALYQAKDAGKNNYQYFTNELKELSQHQLAIENALHEAINQGDFYLYFQPIFDVDTHDLYAVETLLRSNHAILNQISPKKMIEVANEAGLIIQLGYWIIEHVFQQLQLWQKQNSKKFKLSINLSARQLSHTNWFKNFCDLMNKYHIDPKDLIFELTEADVLLNIDNAHQQLSLLTNLGCEIFIDDFGTGYSSLNLIRKLPITGLKLDKSFLEEYKKNTFNEKLIHSIILLANNLNLVLIIEGIETADQLDFIKNYPKVKGQGFFLGTPVEPEKMHTLISNSVG